MLSRSGSSTNNSLQRTKSTTSVKQRRKHPLQAEPINPQTARAHALIAANRAIDRSRAGTSSGSTDGNLRVNRGSSNSHHDQTISFSPASHLQRQRSTLQNRVPKPTVAPRVPEIVPTEGRKYSYGALDIEFGMPGETYGAEPSSYRRLKRARSLLTPIRHAPQSSSEYSETAFSQAPTLRSFPSSVVLRSPGLKLRLKRSLNFLRNGHTSPERVVTAPVHMLSNQSYRPESIALARNQFLQTLEQQRVSKQPSLSLLSKSKRAFKPFRSTVRNEGRQFDGAAKEEDCETLQAEPSNKLTSASLGGRIKNIFKKSKQDKSLPPQQLEASRAHFATSSTAISHESSFADHIETGSVSLRGSRFCIPPNTKRADDGKTKNRSQALSQSSSSESLVSNSKSRVTSWTNSTATGSIVIRPPNEEPKRLSIIKEDGGPHQPSSSAGRHIGGISVFQQPLNLPAGQTVDSQRVYSALLKRIDEEQREMEQTQTALKEIHDAQEQDDIIGHYLFSSPTIRRVESEATSSVADNEKNTSKAVHRLASTTTKQMNTGSTIEDQKEHAETDEDEVLHNSNLPKSYISSNSYKSHGSVRSHQSLGPKNRHKISDSSHELDAESGSVRRRPNSNAKILTHNNFGHSTESVYSRTTNGSTNFDYISPVMSTDYIQPPAMGSDGLTTVLHSQYSKIDTGKCKPASKEPNTPRTTIGKSPWKGWMDCQLEDLEQRRRGINPISHYREHAQIDSDDTQVGGGSFPQNHNAADVRTPKARGTNVQILIESPPSDTKRSTNTLELQTSVTSSAKLREASRSFISVAEKNAIIRRSRSALFNSTNVVKADNSARKESRAPRDTSPPSTLKMIKTRRSQPTFSQQGKTGKENSPLQTNDSPPVSTPGRYSIRLRNSNDLVRLRKGVSVFDLRGRNENALNVFLRESPGDSPSAKSRRTLAARLSKPFDMDVPHHNRPFDSTYLGRRQLEDDNRLSVAPANDGKHRPKTYGDLGSPPFSHNKLAINTRHIPPGPTALPMPSNPSESQRTVSGLSIGQAGKRLVSTLLRNRRKQETSEAELLPLDSPAFI